MDFIDDFIKEYKNNPCLWKGDSVHFKNRAKRQEAYMKLIEIAAKHGEQYNIERTKQKINNLRCAFRHQLKKLIESKNKGESDEPYCPKRKYFESLLFLKDEECPDRKSKREIKHCYQNGSMTKSGVDSNGLESHETELCDKSIDVHAKACESTQNEIYEDKKNYDAIFVKEVEEVPKSFNMESIISKESSGTHLNDVDEVLVDLDQTKGCIRKRSLSTSSELSKHVDMILTNSKVNQPGIDPENLSQQPCKHIHTGIDDSFSNFGKIIAHKLRSMDPTQAIYAEKMISDVLFQGQMKLLTSLSINKLNYDYNKLPRHT